MVTVPPYLPGRVELPGWSVEQPVRPVSHPFRPEMEGDRVAVRSPERSLCLLLLHKILVPFYWYFSPEIKYNWLNFRSPELELEL